MSDRANPRRASFGSLTAGMIVRGTVPSEVLFRGAPPPVVIAPVALAPPVPAAVPAPAAPPVLVERPCERPMPAPRKAMTLRLDPAQHLRLRVLSAYERRSAQEIMVQALTSYLDRHGFAIAAD
jgi:hypothetical protein